MSQAPSSAAPAARSGPGMVLARVGGVPIHIGASWLVMAAAVIVIVGGANSGLGAGGYLVGAVYAVGLLVAVLVHEGAHAVAARAFGIEVHRIVADLWGGHTAYDGRLSSPGRSAVISVAGPVANLLLAALARLAGAGMPGGTAAYLVSGFSLVNLLLAAFNLLPGLPLDGGQIVDAAVWGLTGKRELGLIAGGWSGRVVTILVAGYFLVLPYLAGGRPAASSLLWTLVIGAFMWQGATNAIRVGRARRMLAGVRVRDVLQPVVVVDQGTPLGTLSGMPGIPVSLDETGQPTLVTSQLGPGPGPGPQDPVGSIMTRVPAQSVVEAAPDDDVTDLVNAIQSTGVGVVVVTRGGAAYGLATGEAINAALRGL